MSLSERISESCEINFSFSLTIIQISIEEICYFNRSKRLLKGVNPRVLTNSLVLGSTASGFNSGDVLFQLVMFIILMALLKKFAWGPIMGIMKQREDYISS